MSPKQQSNTNNVQKKSIRISKLKPNKSLFAQVLLTYGTMLFILLVLCLIRVYLAKEPQTVFGIWGLIIGNIAPTTITFIACLMMTDEQVKKDTLKWAWFLIFVIALCFCYIAFEAFNTSEKIVPVWIMGIVNLVIPVIALALLFVSITFADEKKTGIDSDDSHIAAQ